MSEEKPVDTIEPKNILDFWKKHKNKLFGLILIVVGALTGNADRVYDYIPAHPKTLELDGKVVQLETDVAELKNSLLNLNSSIDSIYNSIEEIKSKLNTPKDSGVKEIEIP